MQTIIWITLVLSIVSVALNISLLIWIRNRKPWINGGNFALPVQVFPKRFGQHTMDDWILSIKVKDNETNVG